LAHGIGQRHGIHDGGQHTHVVGRRPVHALRGAGETTENVSAADDNGNLGARRDRFGDVVCQAVGDRHVDAVGLLAHQGFARQLQQQPLVLEFWPRGCHRLPLLPRPHKKPADRRDRPADT
jgi:hypothetical protein